MSPGGRLASKWKKVLAECRASSGGLVRGYVAEQSGISLGSLLYSSQPGEKDSCSQEDCNPCKTGTSKKLSCRKVTCLTCGEGGQCSYYHGETSRTLYSRQKEHFTGFYKRKENNALYKHQELHHPDHPPAEFQFQSEKSFSDPASKQLFEGVSINRSDSSPG